MKVDKEITIYMLNQLYYNSTFLTIDELKKIREVLDSIANRGHKI